VVPYKPQKVENSILVGSVLGHPAKDLLLRREIGCVLIIQQKFRKFKFSEFLLDDKNATYLSS
jgi:hypothetical protein